AEREEERVLVEHAVLLLADGLLPEVTEPDREGAAAERVGAGHHESGGAVDRHVRDGIGEGLTPGKLGEAPHMRAPGGERRRGRRESNGGERREPEESQPPAVRLHSRRPPVVDSTLIVTRGSRTAEATGSPAAVPRASITLDARRSGAPFHPLGRGGG